MMVCSGRLPGAMQLGWPGWTRKPPAAVLQQDAGLVGDDRRAEGMRDRIDERADVAILVDHGDIDRRGIHRRRHDRQIEHPVHPDLVAMLVGEFLRQDPGHVDIDMGGIADILLAHHVGDARGFGFEMKTLDAHRREFRQIETRQDVEHHQHGDAGAVRRALPDVVALVHGADRRRWSRWCGAAKSSSVCRPPMPRSVSTMSSAIAPL